MASTLGSERSTRQVTKPRFDGRLPPRLSNVLGIAWVLGAAGAVMAPALLHGTYLGPFDLLSRAGLTQRAGISVHNRFASDQITEMIPWVSLAWTQVHNGHLPLWNPYSALGTPLAFNWQSAPFGLPALIGYLVPLRLAYNAQTLTTLVVAGTGTYVLARVLRCGVVASAFAATVFELSGGFILYLGWPIASVMSWAGWLFAAAILIIRGNHRVRNVVLFAVALALAAYAGQPDALVVLCLALAVFLVILFFTRLPAFGGSGPVIRPIFDLGLATAAGIALSAPLLLPGLQLLSGSSRVSGGSGLGADDALSISTLVHFFAAGMGNRPIPIIYSLTPGDLAYLGVIPIVLFVAAIGMRLRQSEVKALLGVALVMAIITLTQPAISIMNSLPGLHAVRWPRALVLVGFPVAVVSALGLDLLLRKPSRGLLRKWVASGFGVSAILLFLIWFLHSGSLSPAQAHTRTDALVWSVIEVVVGLAGIGALVLAKRRKTRQGGHATFDMARLVGVSFLVCTTTFLVLAEGPTWSSSSSFATPTADVTLLQQAVGTSIVGFGSSQCLVDPGLGIKPESNVLFGVHELAAYDPILPRTYYTSWQQLTGQPETLAGFPAYSTFCPAITSASIARVYGVGFVLDSVGSRGPTGGIFVRRIGDEDLYRIPGSSVATLTPLSRSRLVVGEDADLPVSHPSPASWDLVIHSKHPGTLRLRLTDVPGWHASIDGRPLTLTSYEGVMLQARIPAGIHHVELRYWPDTFTTGLVLALLALFSLVLALIIGPLQRRKRHGSARGQPSSQEMGQGTLSNPLVGSDGRHDLVEGP
jgi:hypothetical protein